MCCAPLVARGNLLLARRVQKRSTDIEQLDVVTIRRCPREQDSCCRHRWRWAEEVVLVALLRPAAAERSAAQSVLEFTVLDGCDPCHCENIVRGLFARHLRDCAVFPT